MRVLVAGATGAVGSAVVERLGALAEVTGVVLGGRSPGTFRELSARLPVETSSAFVHADDPASVRAALAGTALLVNVAGPDAAVIAPLLRAAIDAGVDYVDISASASIVSPLLDLDVVARERGIAAVLGMGGAPGFTNLLARFAAEKLGVDVDVAFGYVWQCAVGEAAATEASRIRAAGTAGASWETLLDFVSAPVATLRDGRIATVDPWAAETVVELADGAEVRGVAIGSSEPITLGRFLPGCRSATATAGLWPPVANSLWREAARARAEGASVADAVAALYDGLQDHEVEPDPSPVPLGLVARFRDGGDVRALSLQPSGWWATTSIMVTVAAQRLLRGEVPPGVHAPERVFDPAPFFRDAVAMAGLGEGSVVERTW